MYSNKFLFVNNFHFNNFNIADRLKGAPSRERSMQPHMPSYGCEHD